MYLDVDLTTIKFGKYDNEMHYAISSKSGIPHEVVGTGKNKKEALGDLIINLYNISAKIWSQPTINLD